MRLRLVIGCAAVVGLLAAAVPAGAVTLGFGCISGNVAGDCAIGEAQMTVDVTDPGGGQISFLFKNTGGAASFNNPAPEPGTLGLVVAGLVTLAAVRRRG